MHWDTLFSDFEAEVKFHLKTVPRAERRQIIDYIIERVAEIEAHANELTAEERARRVNRTPPKPV